MANYYGSLEAVDCHNHSVRYDMAVKRELAASQVASSGHLQRCSDADTANQYLSREIFLIITNNNGSLEAVDCHIYSVRYDMVWPSKESLQRLSWPHQVTYDIVATPIRPTNA